MNYRHHFHAGNFTEVFKHALLIVLFRAMQRKEGGFLYLDTHAGSSSYDLRQSEVPDRVPEWPDGIGRLWNKDGLSPPLTDYVGLVRQFNRGRGAVPHDLHWYPGSPGFAMMLARPQERLAFVELDEASAASLSGLRRRRHVSVHHMDGYQSLCALLPPPERRAFVLVDPPYEEKREFARVIEGLREALRRCPAAVYAIWYPLTARAGVGTFRADLSALELPPAWCAEMTVRPDDAAIGLNGCGLLVVNPPWQVEREVAPVLPELLELLQKERGGTAQLTWLVPEK